MSDTTRFFKFMVYNLVVKVSHAGAFLGISEKL